MNTVTGKWLNATTSNRSLTNGLTWQQALVLLGVGALAIVLHNTLPGDLKLPGHHGLEWIALLMGTRLTSRYRWATSLSGIGAGGTAMLPIWSGGDPFRWLTYFAAGFIIDLAFMLAPQWQTAVWFLIPLGGLAHASKPLLRFVINAVTGWPFGSVLYGVLYPTATHFMFGAGGVLIALGGLTAWRRLRPPRSE